MKIALALAGALALAAPLAAHAANADHPYQNVDRRNDAGNNTGDSQVDRLNQSQLDNNGIPAGSYNGGSATYQRSASPGYPAAPQTQGY
ncbi:hypothetical protein [Acidisphaera sp. L21]|jgi:hypothetical protein|uniref:hypothetical protein n=1 Tax=Acidisphaera sp. L21 TaxID=1641851 RepID=UPI00131DD786|nr:hypothetical protein [Acidisphaera sp. L21]